MTNHFQGKCAIVTGSAQGIGFKIALELLEQGARVLLNDINQGYLMEAEKQLDNFASNLIIYQGDVSKKSVILKMMELALDKFQSIDIVVANAGLTVIGSFLDFPEEKLHQMFNLNLVGSFILAQAAANQMIKQNNGGRILFLSSVAGMQAHKDMEGYGMTKAALKMLTKSLAPILAAHEITVNCIAPGATETERTLLDPQYAAVWGSVIPTGRVSKTEDIAKAALFLLGPHSSQVTGQTLVIDGGWTYLRNKKDRQSACFCLIMALGCTECQTITNY